ncbi:MAG: metalloregulator ArsR/SmtB family transcription factor [Alphaproteobacteria bacterium]|nr:metalloregulator ArsR/SmtB family transcription factor [Alphaproteobacteria bacterium]
MSADSLSTVLSALADPTRRGLLARLAAGEATVSELAKPYDMSMAAISKHLKVLEKAGLVEQSHHAQYRPRKLNPEPLREVDVWLAEYRKLWEARFDRLDHYLRHLQGKSDA